MRTSRQAPRTSSAIVVYVIILVAFQVFLLTVAVEAFAADDETEARKSLSIAFGVFMGIVPIWGFQLASAIAGAYLLRLNKALVILFANISLPPAIPFILYLSYRCGAYWVGDQANQLHFDKNITLSAIHENAVQYFYGGFTLAVLAALVFGVVSFLLLKWRVSIKN